MQVNMKHFLHRGFAIGQKEIGPFALYSAFAQSMSETMSDSKHLRSGFLFQLGQKSGMAIRHDKQMAGIYRLNV